MTRDDVVQAALNAAKDDYLRGQARVGLVETKAQLVSATVGILLSFLVAIPSERVPHSDAAHVLLLVGAIGSLLISLMLSIAASLLVDVRPPQGAEEFCIGCERLIKAPGDTATTVDASAAEILVGNMCGSYLVASRQVAQLLAERMQKLRTAQVALVFGILLLIVLIGLPYLASAIAVLNTGA